MQIISLNRPLNLLGLKLHADSKVMTWRHAATGSGGKSEPQVGAYEPTAESGLSAGE